MAPVCAGKGTLEIESAKLAAKPKQITGMYRNPRLYFLTNMFRFLIVGPKPEDVYERELLLLISIVASFSFVKFSAFIFMVHLIAALPCSCSSSFPHSSSHIISPLCLRWLLRYARWVSRYLHAAFSMRFWTEKKTKFFPSCREMKVNAWIIWLHAASLKKIRLKNASYAAVTIKRRSDAVTFAFRWTLILKLERRHLTVAFLSFRSTLAIWDNELHILEENKV